MNSRLFFVFISCLFLTLFLTMGVSSEQENCGDGTAYSNCSPVKPYFCSEGILVENASLCGCPANMSINDSLCISNYTLNKSEINFKYVLRGEQGEINFYVYEGMRNYISNLPRSLTYQNSIKPSKLDFKLQKIGDELQEEFILPLVIKIQNITSNKEDQARIAISIVQNIPFGKSNKTFLLIENHEINYSRYPYDVLYDNEGICSEKSELLVLLLKELGYGTAIFYYGAENHEAAGIKCPEKYSNGVSGYCFVETTGPSIITNNQSYYADGVELSSEPEILIISDGESLENLYEYKDAKTFIKLNNILEKKGKLNFWKHTKLKKIKEKYGIE